jgi:hypothetical protein
MPGIFKKIILLLGSILLTLLLVEGILRISRPSLARLANTDLGRHAYRIHANPVGGHSKTLHPDTGVKHPVITNSLGLRQHREFTIEKPVDTLRIGIFGDSFTKNENMRAEFSLSEPLDYLLNEAGVPSEILAFGVDGYGTDQSYLQYRDEGTLLDLDYVFYIFCSNDLIDLIANRLYQFDENGELVYQPRSRSGGPLRSFAGRFCLTYFIMERLGTANDPAELFYEEGTFSTNDEKDALRAELRAKNKPSNDGLKLYLGILDKWNTDTTNHSQRFAVLHLPRNQNLNAGLAQRTRDRGIPAINLYEAFQTNPADPMTGYFFENDSHWNEEGNKGAAVVLFQWIMNDLGKAQGTDAFIGKTLANYYSVFDPARERVSDRWLESNPAPNPDLNTTLRARYLNLETNSAHK